MLACAPPVSRSRRRMGGARQIRHRNDAGHRAQPIVPSLIDDESDLDSNALHPSYEKQQDARTTREAASPRRKTSRKPHEAARAAGMGRAPQDPPPHPTIDAKPKKTIRPSCGEMSASRACRVGGRREAGSG
ncbi:hypothetical protein G6F65_021848 [Rhizopus arrhizus]|nr:hypothetical protein G6F65_021848 [Rhizopus arrhizus]